MAVPARSSATRKRKAAGNSKNPGLPKRPRRSSRVERTLRFMDLPAELRNLVYASYAQERTAYLAKTTLTDLSPLLQANSQVRDEYIPILTQFAKAIKTNVVDFDFRHIVTFINRLSAAEIDSLPSVTPTGFSQAGKRSIDIALRFKSVAYGTTGPRSWLLRRWLKRANSATKKGTKLDSQYSLDLVWQKAVWEGAHRSWRYAVSDFWGVAREGREREEARKLLVALTS